MQKSDRICYWEKALVKSSSSIKEALVTIDQAAVQIGLVVDSNNTLLGTVTDGDVRRSILREVSLDSSVLEVMNTSPMVCNECTSTVLAHRLMRANQVNQLPVINGSGQIVGLHSLIVPRSSKVPNQLLIMAGGFGKRLMPLTKMLPKPMIKVAGKPMLEHIIEKAKTEGFSNFLISVYYLDEKIRDYFGDGTNWGVNIKYLIEPEPLGTGGALTLIDPIPLHNIVVTNGDVISNVPFRKILNYHQEQAAGATMAVYNHEWENPYGVIETNGNLILEIKEKPVQKSKINAGVYVISPKLIKKLAANSALNMTDFFSLMIAKSEKVVAYPLHEKWLDVGRHEDLMEAEKFAFKI